MRTDELIEQLSAQAVPVRRPLPPLAMLALWVAVTAAGLVVMNGSLFHMRDDLHAVLGSARFLASLTTLALLLGFGALDALRRGRPGMPPRPAVALGTKLSLAGFLASLALGVWNGDSARVSLDLAGMHCSAALLAMSLVPGLVLFVALRRLAPVEPGAAASLAGLAMGAAGAVGLTLHCATPHALHLILWHALPILALAVLGEKVGHRLLSW